jgi:hypothetical protein
MSSFAASESIVSQNTMVTGTKQTRTPTHVVDSTYATIGLSKNQDYAAHGTCVCPHTGEPIEWSIVADGHGPDYVIDVLRNMQLGSFMEQDDPIRALQRHICAIVKTQYSGSTISYLKLRTTSWEVGYWGDSRIDVYENGDRIFKSEPHNSNNSSEMQRLASAGATIHDSSTFELTSDEEMVQLDCKYIRYPYFGCQIAMSKSLGHNDATAALNDESCDIHRGEINPKSNYRFVMISDGIEDVSLIGSTFGDRLEPLIANVASDIAALSTSTSCETEAFGKLSKLIDLAALLKAKMVKYNCELLTAEQFHATATCEELVRLAESRWTQKWNTFNMASPFKKYGKMQYTCAEQYDDVCAVVVSAIAQSEMSAIVDSIPPRPVLRRTMTVGVPDSAANGLRRTISDNSAVPRATMNPLYNTSIPEADDAIPEAVPAIPRSGLCRSMSISDDVDV